MSTSKSHPILARKPVTEEMRNERHGIHNYAEFRAVLSETYTRPGAISFFAHYAIIKQLNDSYTWALSQLFHAHPPIPQDVADICEEVVTQARPLFSEFSIKRHRSTFLIHVANVEACEEIFAFKNETDDPLIYWAQIGVRQALQSERKVVLDLLDGTISAQHAMFEQCPDLEKFVSDSERLLMTYYWKKSRPGKAIAPQGSTVKLP